MKSYLELLDCVLQYGHERIDRTGVGTRSLFGYRLCLDLQEGFPLLTTKRVFLKGIICELLWFLKGSCNVRELQQQGVHIWDEWAAEDGDLGPIYGVQWRNWGKVDQMARLVHGLRQNPYSRRHIVSSWNVSDIDKMALPPCHLLMQFYVEQGKLSCQVYQRSADIFLGVPFNIASYALLTEMLAQVVGLKLGELIFAFGDLHLYSNHIDQAKEQLSRKPLQLPTMLLNPKVHDLFSFRYEDFKLVNYNSHPLIKAPKAI